MNTLVRRTAPFVHPMTLMRPLRDIEPLFREAIDNLAAPAPYLIKRDGASTTIEVNLAGFSRDHIDVTFDPEKLAILINAEARHVESEESKKGKKDNEVVEVSAPERLRHGFFDRKASLSFTVPENIDAESITSQYVDGVLSVTFSRVEPEKKPAKSITIG